MEQKLLCGSYRKPAEGGNNETYFIILQWYKKEVKKYMCRGQSHNSGRVQKCHTIYYICHKKNIYIFHLCEENIKTTLISITKATTINH